MVLGSCCSFDALVSDFPLLHLLKFRVPKTGQYLAVSTPSDPVHLQFCPPTNFRKQMTFCHYVMFSLPNDTNLNNFHPELFAVRCLVHTTFTLHTMFAIVQSGAIYK